MDKKIIEWLLAGDISIIYQANRDLLDASENDLKKLQLRIAREGWGKRILELRYKNGLWGGGFYLPKWISTHYTLLNLKNMGFPKGITEINESVSLILNSTKSSDGGISYSRKSSDVCVNGMILNFGAYFINSHPVLHDIIDYLLNIQMDDGGWNCKCKSGATHSSVHSTLSVLEGLSEFIKPANAYRNAELKLAIKQGIEFLMYHHLYKSHRTGKMMDPKMIRLSYPSYWRFDILRALDYFQNVKISYDKRMDDALNILNQKRRSDGRWNLEGKHPGLVHFEMEKSGEPGRWNTLRALRVMKWYVKRKQQSKDFFTDQGNNKKI